MPKTGILAPETTIGPYYIESTIRKDVREGQKGVEMLLDLQFIDVSPYTYQRLLNLIIQIHRSIPVNPSRISMSTSGRPMLLVFMVGCLQRRLWYVVSHAP